jgi:hypothetical protein
MSCVCLGPSPERLVMKILSFVIIAIVVTFSSAWSQGTGNSFPTPNGQIAPGTMLLVPSGPISSGQPVAAPPGVLDPLPVLVTNPSSGAATGASSNPVNGTIAVTNTFQSLITMNASRKACSFQNQGTHNMYFSVASSPTLANSYQVTPFTIFYCSGPGNITITDAIQITGTAGDAFAGGWQ